MFCLRGSRMCTHQTRLDSAKFVLFVVCVVVVLCCVVLFSFVFLCVCVVSLCVCLFDESFWTSGELFFCMKSCSMVAILLVLA